MKSLLCLAVTALIGCFISLAAAAESPVYPVPQELRMQPGKANPVVSVKVRTRGEDSRGGLWEKVRPVSGAYALRVIKGKVEVYAHDAAGAFYARQTLSQLMQGRGHPSARRDTLSGSTEKMLRGAMLPDCTIADWPDVPYRGVVEGYYGAPWSYEDRVALLRFFGRNKMNVYIYGPKDDEYHHGEGCYKPYPAEMARRLSKLVRTAKENHVWFVWAIHPADTVRWQENGGKTQLDALCRKMQQMYDLGVRAFALFVDDTKGEIGRTDRQIQLANYLEEHFIRRHPDVLQQLIFCPTGYCKPRTNPGTLAKLGAELPPCVQVMWTGDGVVHDIVLGNEGRNGLRWVKGHMKRAPFIWYNWPCNDFKRARLCMGRAYGNGTEPEMRGAMSGFVANPMEHAEASMVGLFCVADYTWNITAYDSQASWAAGISRLFPQSAEAMRVFCRHNSNLAPNVHHYAREESADCAADADAAAAAARQGEAPGKAGERVLREFSAMEKAGSALLRAEDAAGLRAEIKPWLQKMQLLGRCGAAAGRALKVEEPASMAAEILRAGEARRQMRLITRPEWRAGVVKTVDNVEVGASRMAPAMDALYAQASQRVYAALSGQKEAKASFTCMTGWPAEKMELATDGQDATFWINRQPQTPGDWFGLRFSASQIIRNVRIVMAGPQAQDFVRRGQLEYSPDGKSWLPLGEPTATPIVEHTLPKPLTALAVRYRMLQEDPKWVNVCEFSVNAPSRLSAKSDIPGFGGITATAAAQELFVNRVMEFTKASPGQFLELRASAPVHPEELTVDVDNSGAGGWGILQIILPDGSLKQVKGSMKGTVLSVPGSALPKDGILGMRFTNNGSGLQNMRINAFSISLPPASSRAPRPDLLLDADFSTALDCSSGLSLSIPAPADSKQVALIGSAPCRIQGATLISASPALRIFLLPTPSSSIRLTCPPTPNTALHELIFTP
ncbi:MAG: beta-N-acetylglucosaminidase domain-containing protein [Akkermansia sp.]